MKAIFRKKGKSKSPSEASTSQQHRPSPNAAPGAAQPSSSARPSLTTAESATESFPSGLELWHDCPEATVDICFVHGLMGNRASTWTAQGQSTPWPKTLLPCEVPGARLLTYGYNAYVVHRRAVSINRLTDHATNLLNDLTTNRASPNASSRPIIFVVHSLGGLVCKEAILLSQNHPEPHLRDIFEDVVGIAFMGTPHRGSWMATWAKIPASALGLVKSTNKSLLAVLETDNQLLKSIQDRFLRMVRELREGGRRLELTCFFEELPLRPLGHIVPQESATLEGYTSVSIPADHRNMVRFGSAADTGFVRLAGELRRWVGQDIRPPADQGSMSFLPLSRDTPTSHSAKAHYHIPFYQNKRFVGREETLKALWDKLFLQGLHTVAVVGLGGMGKTQVALELAYWTRERSPDHSLFWVPALSVATFDQAYTEIARKLGIKSSGDEDIRESVREYLSSEASGPWMLIVDNADDAEMIYGSDDAPKGLDQFLPQREGGKVLFTTRSKDVARKAADEVVELKELTLPEATRLLEKWVIRKDLIKDEALVAELIHELTYLPLAITQAAAYLERTEISIAEYLRLLRDTEMNTVELLSQELPDRTRYKESKNAVAATWVVSFKKIHESDSNAARLLEFMSQIEPKAIPLSLLPECGSKVQTQNAIGTLHAYAFVSRRDSMLDMHSLVHLATRIWLRKEDAEARATESAIRHLAATFPDDDYENRDLWREYLPHALRILQRPGTDHLDKRYKLTFWVGRCLNEDGRIREAVRCFEEYSRWANTHFPEDHPNRLSSQHELARVYESDGQIKKAVTLLEHVVAVKEKLAEDDPSRLASQHELGIAYQADGQIKKAVTLLEQVVAVEEKLAEDDPSRLASQHELGIAYQADGQIKKAVTLLEQVVTVKEKLPEDRLDRLAPQHELARVYLADGQIKKAVMLLEHVVAIQEKKLTEDHPSRLASQNILAGVYEADGQIKKAVTLLEYVVAIWEKKFAEDHPSRLASQNLLAGVYLADGQIKKAVTLLEYVVAIREKKLAEDHPSRLTSQYALGIAYQADGQLPQAIQLLKHVVAVESRTLREDHPVRLISVLALKDALEEAGQ